MKHGKPMNEIRPPDGTRFDAIVIGSGAGGSACAARLAAAGRRVLVVEKGGVLPRDDSTLDVRRVIQEGAFRSRERWVSGAVAPLVPEEYFNVGGKTKWYGAALVRFSPAEFEADEAHLCPGWPVGYQALAPYYEQAEAALELNAFEPEPALRRLLARLASRRTGWRAQPLALGLRRDILEDPREASHFDGFSLPSGRKADAEHRWLTGALCSGRVRLLHGSAVTALLGDPADPTRVSGVRLCDGRSARASAVVLAAGALHSPRLLQRYLEDHGLGWLPMADNVGRHLKLHLLSAVVALASVPQRDLLRKTVLLVHPDLPHSSVQPLGFDGELLASLFPAAISRPVARALGRRAYGFFLQTEDGSCRGNRVLEAGMPDNPGALPMLDYDPGRCVAAQREHRRLVSRFRRALLRAGYPSGARGIGIQGTAHACGTLMAGEDPRRSVVDADGRVHGLAGLYAADGSVLPRVSRVNPALTIYAWGLRLADHLAPKLLCASSLPVDPAEELGS